MDIESTYDRDQLKTIPDLVALDFGRAGESRNNVFLIRARFSKKSKVSPSLVVTAELKQLPLTTLDLIRVLFAMHAGVVLPEIEALQAENSEQVWIARQTSTPAELKAGIITLDASSINLMRRLFFSTQGVILPTPWPFLDSGLQTTILDKLPQNVGENVNTKPIAWNDGTTLQRKLSVTAINAVADALRRFKSA